MEQFSIHVSKKAAKHDSEILKQRGIKNSIKKTNGYYTVYIYKTFKMFGA